MKYCLFVAFLFLAACGVSENIKPGATIDPAKKPTVLMLGFSPDYRVHLFRGTFENNIWDRRGLNVPEVNIFPSNGYILVEVKPTTPEYPLGVGTIFIGYTGYGPCQDSLTPVFDLKEGAVNYVGHLAYTMDGNQLHFTSSIREDEAKNYLKKYYPGLVDSFVLNPMKVVKVISTFCNKRTMTIPIYINH